MLLKTPSTIAGIRLIIKMLFDILLLAYKLKVSPRKHKKKEIMKTIFFKGFVLAALFTLVGFVASAQQNKIANENIKLSKVELKTIDSSSKSEAKMKNNQIKGRSSKITNYQALPIEKKTVVRKETLPSK